MYDFSVVVPSSIPFLIRTRIRLRINSALHTARFYEWRGRCSSLLRKRIRRSPAGGPSCGGRQGHHESCVHHGIASVTT